MSKGDLPVAHIVAIILGIIVITLLSYLVYTNFIKVTATTSEEICKAKLQQFCTLWSFCNYVKDNPSTKDSIKGCRPNNADFYNAKNNPDCESYKTRLSSSVDADFCRNLLSNK